MRSEHGTRRRRARWRMAPPEQQAARLRIGIDYPEPVVDHAVARQRTLARFAVTRA